MGRKNRREEGDALQLEKNGKRALISVEHQMGGVERSMRGESAMSSDFDSEEEIIATSEQTAAAAAALSPDKAAASPGRRINLRRTKVQ